MLRAAFTSRSCTVAAAARPLPHVQRQALAQRSRTRSTPSTTGTSGRPRPGRGRTTAHLYSSMPRSSRQPASLTARASVWLLEHVAHRSGPRSRPLGSRGRAESTACAGDPGAGRRSARARGPPSGGPSPGSPSPSLLRASCRCARASRCRSRRSWRGLATFSPVDSVTRDVIPASTPTTASDGRGVVATVSSHSRDTKPAPGRVPRDGHRASARPRRAADATSGCPAARPSSPASARRRASVNAERVYSADARDFVPRLEPRVHRPALGEEVGERRLAGAADACCSGTEDTSPGTPARGSCFHSVSIAEDCT